ncbi:helix-turn-helix domain-containing protein [Solihabitans fulvus]|uniref:Helix-turn-helix domain-containing protein n=1 Tax=Solihabitans fulvus TaxID=1892852 RepID=A0A5B2X478_9PSEU|nr:helix-turn-helix transcriptional regulator [Solihabitans fulvus]KAA2258044.1 helix-turn-helix domain-containing protein [Solihabitans fulvus]
MRLDHTYQQRQFGRSLRRLREQARIDTTEAAVRTKIDVDKLNRIERGQPPTHHELTAILDTYGLLYEDWQPYLRRLDHARKRGWWRTYGLPQNHFAGIEDDAILVREFQLGLIPEPLQTGPYIRTVLAASRRPHHPNEPAVRLRRQQRLTDDNPRRYHVVIDEAALTTPLPDNEITRAQLRHILDMATLPNITVQVITRAAGPHHGRKGSFQLLTFPEPETDPLLHVPHIAGESYENDPDATGAAQRLFRQLSTLALGQDESWQWIAQLATEPRSAR